MKESPTMTNAPKKDDFGILLLGAKEWNSWRRLDTWNSEDEEKEEAVVVHSGPKNTKEWCRKANVANTPFVDMDLRDYNLRGLDLQNVHFTRADLSNVDFEHSNLDGAVFDDAKLDGANLGQVTGLRNGSLLGISYNSSTTFPSAARMDGCQIERAVVEDFKSQQHWSDAALRRLRIRDDLAELRSYFGGFSRWINLAAVILFLMPYIWFVIWQSARGYFQQSGEGVRLLVALMHLIWTGGASRYPDWTWSPLNSMLFAFLIILNSARVFLVWKTLKLEEQHSITGLYPRFYLTGTSHTLYRLVRLGVPINLAIAFLHALLHLWNTRLPSL